MQRKLAWMKLMTITHHVRKQTMYMEALLNNELQNPTLAIWTQNTRTPWPLIQPLN